MCYFYDSVTRLLVFQFLILDWLLGGETVPNKLLLMCTADWF